MKIWLPYIIGGSGTDVFTQRLAELFQQQGVEATPQSFAHNLQYAPHVLGNVSPPEGTTAIITNSWNGFAFARSGIPMITVEHLCVHDEAYAPFKNFPQAMFHRFLVKPMEQASFACADAAVCVSHYTARNLKQHFPNVSPRVIHNGADIDYFTPTPEADPTKTKDKFTLLFVGNLSKRKGADMLDPIMRALGDGYELKYTGGLRNEKADPITNGTPLNRLKREEVRAEYRNADALLFPSRLEGLSLVMLEAKACGLPIVATDAHSAAEIIKNGEDGFLCPDLDANAFATAIRKIAETPDLMASMQTAARQNAVALFDEKRVAQDYLTLIKQLSA